MPAWLYKFQALNEVFSQRMHKVSAALREYLRAERMGVVIKRSVDLLMDGLAQFSRQQNVASQGMSRNSKHAAATSITDLHVDFYT